MKIVLPCRRRAFLPKPVVDEFVTKKEPNLSREPKRNLKWSRKCPSGVPWANFYVFLVFLTRAVFFVFLVGDKVALGPNPPRSKGGRGSARWLPVQVPFLPDPLLLATLA